MKKLLFLLFLASPAAAQIEPNFTQGSMQQTINTTQTVNEQVVTEIYGGDYSYYSGSNVIDRDIVTISTTTSLSVFSQ
jgi:hypothetical protein